MDVHPTPFPGNKTQSVKSKYKQISEAPKQKIKEAPPQRHRRTFGTIRDPNVPEKTVHEKPKAKSSTNQISIKQPKAEPEIAPLPKPEPAKKTPQNGSSDRATVRKKKSVAFSEKLEGSVTNSPAKEVDGVKTPLRPPFSVKPVKVPGTPYLSAEKCSSCRFDRLETASYWLGQIKSAEFVGKHFVSATFFRLANDCKAEPARNLQTELKKYLARHQYLSSKTEWEDVSRIYGLIKGCETTSKEGNMNLFDDETASQNGSKLRDINNVQEQRLKNENDEVKELYEEGS